MAENNRSTPQSIPEDIPGSSNLGGPEHWVLMALNNLREDIHCVETRMSSRFDDVSSKFDDVSSKFDDVNENITKVDQRLSVVEGRILKSTWLVAGALMVLVLLYGAYEWVSPYVDVTIDLKESAEGQQ